MHIDDERHLLRARLMPRTQLFPLLAQSSTSYALQVFALCTTEDNMKKEEQSTFKRGFLLNALKRGNVN